MGQCKECKKAYARLHGTSKEYDQYRQRYNFTRIFNHRYTNMGLRVNGKTRREYRVQGTDMLSSKEFMKWCRSLENMKNFYKLWVKWELSGFPRGLTPSIDRIDNLRGYTVDNIQWLTVTQNNKKGVR